MKITEIVCQILRIKNVEAKTASSQDSVLVRVRTDTGLEGIGEADSSPEMVKAVIDAPFSHNVATGLNGFLARAARQFNWLGGISRWTLINRQLQIPRQHRELFAGCWTIDVNRNQNRFVSIF